ncbi:hypothetical protein DL93DRAFT_2089198 [Clavulina sp. PMI_390]|nr:hypothetical protein DL93DRAFT_2089198 [Clavulina sp. PMI_390]
MPFLETCPILENLSITIHAFDHDSSLSRVKPFSLPYLTTLVVTESTRVCFRFTRLIFAPKLHVLHYTCGERNPLARELDEGQWIDVSPPQHGRSSSMLCLRIASLVRMP